MKHRRLIIICAVAAAAVTALAGCSSASSSGSGASSSATSAAGKRVVYVPGLTGNPFYTTVGCGAALEASKIGMNFSTQGAATYDPALQINVVNAVVASKPAAMMISVTDQKALAEPLIAAKKAGIKVITIDGDLSDKSIASSNIQADDVAGGTLAAQALAKLVGGKGEVMGISNAAGNSIVSDERAKGFEDGLKAYPGMKFIGLQYSGNNTSKAASIASTAAATNPNLVGIFALQTNNTEGSITGLREAGKTQTVKLVGFDTSDPIVQGIKDGAVAADIVQYPYMEGQLGVQFARDLIEGKSVPRNQTVPFVVATPANINTAKVQQFIYKTHC